ncbi:MAG TPA: serine hydrolase [Gemmatimonadaceae bacterium]|nr:serine hydrolase [Gemmatimonadaceae bacterium]
MSRPIVSTLVLAATVSLIGARAAQSVSADDAPYFPPRDAWERKRPAEVAMDSGALQAAIEFARANENRFPRDLRRALEERNVSEPYPELLGPFRERGGPAGLVIRHGYIVASWGDVDRADMTFSVAKSYLATVAGLALDDGLIRNVNDPVRAYVRDGGFEGRNATITWHHLLTQTSEWEGTLWDKPDVADRREGRDRVLRQPGTFWEYNDVRVNRTALALLRVWKRPLPEVLKERIMDPIGASSTWEWHGYRNSFVEIDGKRMQSVSGGGHWGGGVWASTHDHARFGLLMLRRGAWGDRRLLSEKWITMATTPTPIKPVYGYMWWLNPDRARYRSASPSSVFALGAGGNVIWIDPEHDLVVVTRWLAEQRVDEFMGLVMKAVN